MTLEILPQKFTVCKVAQVSASQMEGDFCFVGKTDREISLVCPTALVPLQTLAREDGWRGFRIRGTLDFSLVGILSRISKILAEAEIGIFAISTYDTDYILFKEVQLEQVIYALERQKYEIVLQETASGYNL